MRTTSQARVVPARNATVMGMGSGNPAADTRLSARWTRVGARKNVAVAARQAASMRVSTHVRGTRQAAGLVSGRVCASGDGGAVGGGVIVRRSIVLVAAGELVFDFADETHD
jgi:hypothetical protein